MGVSCEAEEAVGARRAKAQRKKNWRGRGEGVWSEQQPRQPQCSAYVWVCVRLCVRSTCETHNGEREGGEGGRGEREGEKERLVKQSG